MKRFLLLLSLVFASVIAAHAEYYFLWEFDQSESGDPLSFSLAKVRVDGDGIDCPVYLALADDGGVSFETLATEVDPEAGPLVGETVLPNYAKLSDFANDNYSFFVELYSLDDELLGVSGRATFEELRLAGSVYEDMATTGITPYNFGLAVEPVPEPTSGVLVLLGFGVLALRRRKQVGG